MKTNLNEVFVIKESGDFSRAAQKLVNDRSGGLLDITLVDALEKFAAELDKQITKVKEDDTEIMDLKIAFAKFVQALMNVGNLI